MPTPTQPIKPVNPLNKTSYIAKKAITVSIISIVVAAVSISLALINYQTASTHDQDIRSSLRANLKAQTLLTTLNSDWQKQSIKVQSLEHALIKLKNRQDIPLQKTLAETSYLVHLANLHLSIGHDKRTALNILQTAYQHLLPVKNTIFLPLKQSLLADINHLDRTPIIDLNTLYNNINLIGEQIAQLNPLPDHTPDHFKNEMHKIIPSQAAQAAWYERLLESMKKIKQVFIIHRVENPAIPVTSPAKIMFIKENIQIKLSMAQWALLHQDQRIYQSSLKLAHKWLAQYFSMRSSIQPLLKQLNSLEKAPISAPLPTLEKTLTALAHINLTPPKAHKIKKQEDNTTASKTPHSSKEDRKVPHTPKSNDIKSPVNSVEI